MFFYKDTAEAASTASFHISNNPAAPSVQPEEGKISRCDPDLPDLPYTTANSLELRYKNIIFVKKYRICHA